MNNNKQQTAVEKLVEQLLNGKALTPFIIEKAKEIEKKQAQRTFEESRLTNAFVGFKHKTFEDYYSETYGGNK